MKKKILSLALFISVLLIVASCKSTDVIGNTSITSFNEILNAIPDNIKADEVNGGWSLNAPDGSAKFIWSKDYSKSPYHDVMLVFDAQPFINAGLDVNKLPEGLLI